MKSQYFHRLFYSIIGFLLCTSSNILYAQDIDQIVKSKWTEVNGGIDASSISYRSIGITPRRDPHTLFVNGRINVSVKSFSFPFSINYTNNDFSFSRPYNRFQFAPKYKWVQLYFKDHAMTFSKYNLNGANVNGLGFTLTPKKWIISGTYGNLLEGFTPSGINDNELNREEIPSYKRTGGGLSIGYSNNGSTINFQYFKAKDIIGSLPENFQLQSALPEESQTLSAKFNHTFFDKLNINGEVGLSQYHRDISNKQIKDNTKEIFTAYSLGIKYPFKILNLGLNYEKVTPGYKNLGSYYFNDDFENISGLIETSFLNGKLGLIANVGRERNNLENTELSETKRWVANISANAQPFTKLNIAVTYNNFTNFTNIRPTSSPYFQNELDTLNYFQVSRQWQVNSQYTLPQNRGISFSGSNQVTENGGTLDQGQNTGINNYQLSGGYNQFIKEKDIRYSVLMNTFESNTASFVSTNTGPTVSVSKTWFDKKLRGTLSNSYYFSKTKNPVEQLIIKEQQVNTLRLSLSFQTKTKALPFKDWLEEKFAKNPSKNSIKNSNLDKSTKKYSVSEGLKSRAKANTKIRNAIKDSERRKYSAAKLIVHEDGKSIQEVSTVTGIELPKDVQLKKQKKTKLNTRKSEDKEDAQVGNAARTEDISVIIPEIKREALPKETATFIEEIQLKKQKKTTKGRGLSERHRFSLSFVWNAKTVENEQRKVNLSTIPANQRIQEFTLTLRYNYSF